MKTTKSNIKKEESAGKRNGIIDSQNPNHPLVLDNIRKSKIKFNEWEYSPLVVAYWKGWTEGFSQEYPIEANIVTSA